MNKPEQKKNNSALFQQTAIFTGPIPPPVVLKDYESIVPGAAKIIIEMAEKQSNHRMELEKQVINSDISRSKQGLVFGFMVAMSGIIGSVVLGIYGNPVVSGILGFSTLGSLVGVFIYGSQSRVAERNKMKE